MSKKISFFIALVFFGLGYLFNIEKDIHKKLVVFNHYLESSYSNIVTLVNNSYDKYIDQLEHIDMLKKQNREYQKYKVLYEQNHNVLLNYQENNQTDTIFDNNYIKIKALSYLKLNDFSKIVLEDKLKQKDKIYALVTIDGKSAGTVIYKNNKTIAYLNQNERCNYAVYIGKNKSPGITSGMYTDGKLIINYVPIWKTVSIGDEVITSSMDNLFPYGIKVGKVISFKINENTQQVLVEPYASVTKEREFYLYLK